MKNKKCSICRKKILKEDGNNFLHIETMLQGSCLFKDDMYFCDECSGNVLASVIDLSMENIAINYGLSKNEQWARINKHITQGAHRYARMHHSLKGRK